MKLVKSSVEYLPQEEGLEGIYKQIERCTRVSYKSEDKITEDSAKKFVDMLIKSKHYAGLEHGTVYLYLEVNSDNAFSKFEYPLAHFTAGYNWGDVVGNICARYRTNEYSKVNGINEQSETEKGYTKVVRKCYIVTNYRVIIENNWLDDLQFICSPTEYHEKRYSFKFITDIGVCRELLRHKLLCAA